MGAYLLSLRYKNMVTVVKASIRLTFLMFPVTKHNDIPLKNCKSCKSVVQLMCHVANLIKPLRL